MAPAPTLSRSELLAWIQGAVGVEYTRVEQCGTGAAYCLLFEAIFPNTINVAKVVREPRNETQMMHNYKLLQQGFSRRRLTRDVNVERLIKCRLQDNLEFTQWLAGQWVEHVGEIEGGSASASGSRRSSMRPSRNVSGPGTSNVSASSTTHKGPSRPQAAAPAGNGTSARGSRTPSDARISRSASSSSSAAVPALQSQITNLQSKLSALQLQHSTLQSEYASLEQTSEELNTERNFYLEKLRDVESLCLDVQEGVLSLSNTQLLEAVLEILYSTKEGFEVIDESNYPDPPPDDENADEIPGPIADAVPSAVPDLLKTPKSDLLDLPLKTPLPAPANILDDEETF